MTDIIRVFKGRFYQQVGFFLAGVFLHVAKDLENSYQWFKIIINYIFLFLFSVVQV